MIPARKSPPFARFFAADAERRLRRGFHEVRARGIDGLRDALVRQPVLLVTNHTAWWDPIVAVFVSLRVVRADAYAMMDAANLRRLPFFGMVGAFGVDPHDPRDGARAIRYAAKLLDTPGRLVWVFPQGREIPITVHPLEFQPGSGQIARVARRAIVIPGALRYEMGGTPKPTAWLSFGPPLPTLSDPHAGTLAQEEAVGEELAHVERAIAEGEDESFERLLAPRPDQVFSVAQSLLAWVARRRIGA